jgi:hypothetical protein
MEGSCECVKKRLLIAGYGWSSELKRPLDGQYNYLELILCDIFLPRRLSVMYRISILAWVTRGKHVETDPSGRSIEGEGLRPLACWDCGFESRRAPACLSLVNVVFCQVEVLRRADHSSRGVLPSVGCLSVIVMPR